MQVNSSGATRLLKNLSGNYARVCSQIPRQPYLFALALGVFTTYIIFTSFIFTNRSNIGKTPRLKNNVQELKDIKSQYSIEEKYSSEDRSAQYGEGDFIAFSTGAGNFGGYKRLLELLDVENSKLARRENFSSTFSGCHLVLGDTTNPRNKEYWMMKNVVWLSVNAEDPSNEQIWKGRKKTQNPQKKTMQTRIKTSRNHRQMILGNFWKRGMKDHIKPKSGVISLWIPFLSLNFSEREQHTPLDLNKPSTLYHHHQRSYTAAYMNSLCVPFREKLWDNINIVLNSMKGTKFRTDALGKCHGSIPRNSKHQKDGHYSYDGHVKTYEKYDFVACAEHIRNDIGYVTEKIGNVILAGRVPIYGGYSHISRIINPKRFIAHNDLKLLQDLGHNDTKYYQMIDEPAVSREVMLEFFSWHPAVISKYSNDKLRQKIFHALKQLCDDIKAHDK